MIISFNRTIEELKLGLVSTPPFWYFTFNRTIEELKLRETVF